jgi:chromosome segregation ATPase
MCVVSIEKQRACHGQAITGLERDAAALKREVADRDATIGDKEKRIHDLKRKNQELEKFKFVLDYKIKELKRGIEPREAELMHLKGQIQARARCRRPAAASSCVADVRAVCGDTSTCGVQRMQARMHGARSADFSARC